MDCEWGQWKNIWQWCSFLEKSHQLFILSVIISFCEARVTDVRYYSWVTCLGDCVLTQNHKKFIVDLCFKHSQHFCCNTSVFSIPNANILVHELILFNFKNSLLMFNFKIYKYYCSHFINSVKMIISICLDSIITCPRQSGSP